VKLYLNYLVSVNLESLLSYGPFVLVDNFYDKDRN